MAVDARPFLRGRRAHPPGTAASSSSSGRATTRPSRGRKRRL